MPQNFDQLAKRLRRKVYTSVDEVAKDFAEGLAGIDRQNNVSRKLASDTLAGIQGGTTVGVGDPSALQGSDYLVQNPQPGRTPDVGSGLESRRQTRIRESTRVLPAMVTEDAIAGDTEVAVTIVGDGTGKTLDSLTGSEIVANAAQHLADNPGSIIGTAMMAKVTGQPIVAAGQTGMQPIAAGRTVNVVVTEQYQEDTTWANRQRKNLPTVTPILKCRSACLVNGLACASPRCIPSEASSNFFAEGGSSPTDDWLPANTTGWTPNRPWCVVEMSIDTLDGTLDRNLAEFTYYDYGLVDGSGEIVFAGVPFTVPQGSGQYYIYLGLGTECYGWYLLVGCATGQEVTFGSISIGAPANYIDPTLTREWTLIDSNFPILIP